MKTETDATATYSILAKNKPGELAKLTRTLLDSGLRVKSLAVFNAGPRASIRFSTANAPGVREALRKSGLRLEV